MIKVNESDVRDIVFEIYWQKHCSWFYIVFRIAKFLVTL